MRKRRHSALRQAARDEASARDRTTLLPRLLREPLLHFMLLGALIFGGWKLTLPASSGNEQRITISANDVERLRQQAMRQWGREPTPAALATLVEADIREQVLYREALALGLDRDDVVIRRRLVQKLDSLAQDRIGEPDEAALLAYWEKHYRDKPANALLAMEQVYFSPSLRGANAYSDAKAALARIESGQKAIAGDPFLMPASVEQQDQAALARDYGDAFAQQVFALPAGRWQGPLESSLGFHLVRVTSRAAADSSSFAASRAQVRLDYLRDALAAAQDENYRKLRARYQVSIAAGAVSPASAPAGEKK